VVVSSTTQTHLIPQPTRSPPGALGSAGCRACSVALDMGQLSVAWRSLRTARATARASCIGTSWSVWAAATTGMRARRLACGGPSTPPGGPCRCSSWATSFCRRGSGTAATTSTSGCRCVGWCRTVLFWLLPQGSALRVQLQADAAEACGTCIVHRLPQQHGKTTQLLSPTQGLSHTHTTYTLTLTHTHAPQAC
jgi:hypothetical protein